LQQDRRSARIVVIMGVSGAGKTTIGKALAERLGWTFQEGDALHPPANIAKMNSGKPLDDSDRAPWLGAIAALIDDWRQRGVDGVISCSALKRRYRDIIDGDRPGVHVVYLEGSRELLARRLASRRGHFMPPGLLDSQLATLEPPAAGEHVITVDIDAAVNTIVDRIVAKLSLERSMVAPVATGHST